MNTRMSSLIRFAAVLLLGHLLWVSTSEAQNAFFKRLEKERVESAGFIEWEQVGPGNAGFANLMRYHPTIPGKVMQCPDMWNAYQSDDNGKRWYAITDSDGDASLYHIHDLYYSMSDPDFGLAINMSELWMSKDGGKNWRVVKNCPWYKIDEEGRDKEGWRKKVASLAIHPTQKNMWFVGGGGNVRGQMWKSCYNGVTAKNHRGKEALNEGKLWRTTNGGRKWELVNEGLHPKAQVGRIIVNPSKPKQVFASSNYGVYRSNDAGKTWNHVSKGKLDNDTIMDMDYYHDPESGKFILYVLDQVHYLPAGKTTKCTGGVFRSDDGGQTWTNLSAGLTLDLNRLTGGVPKNYYKYIAKWLDISEGDARKTYPQLPKQALQYFNMISADPSREGTVYAGFADPQVQDSIMPGRLWATHNDGKKWISTARLYADAWKKDRAYWSSRGNPTSQNMRVGHSSPHMRFGNDYALRSMRGIDVGADGSVMIISDHSTMLSTNRGKTWTQVDEDRTPSGALVGRGNSNLPALTTAQDRRENTTLLGSGEHNLWIPTDDSPNQYQALKFIDSTQETVRCIAYDPYDVNIVYATSSRQAHKQNIFRSTDRGRKWSNYGVATPATNKWLDDFYTNSLMIDPINNQYMYHGITRVIDPNKSTQGGFFVSKDKGKTFQQSNKGLPSPARIMDLELDPRDNSRKSLFAAAQFNEHNYKSALPIAKVGGLYHSSDRGASWKKIKIPASIKGINQITFDHLNRIYITTGYRGGGSGVWHSDDYGKTWNQTFKYPGAFAFDVSPYDSDLIAVSVKFMSRNPGIYFSRNRGKTWAKGNTGIANPHRLEEIKFDLFDPGKVWIATLGCGFYIGRLDTEIYAQVVEAKPDVVEHKKSGPIQMEATIVNDKYADAKIVWKSDNPGVATVDANGKVTPVGRGQVKIWATTEDGRFTDFSVVTIHKAPKGKKPETAEPS
ncbi:VPS10 domain-containing protein [Algisphaera agarilytica]|uniref:Photosystem II stability/assembly factor-like uncharacterized protein n=1 Tax=Algisphaera agarilytica TaxID=1385975 RepID=A0A7X0H352_9BACT|nr:Ig-like domain-containing protein [Algisphaera agarilytica]MBB6428423.1 photosystem II stability/assembly factor-like uncharacterized protein [Algisphaera agarilytica]